jgi:hypothetical protein
MLGVLVRRSLGTGPLGKWQRQRDNIKMNLKETGYKDPYWNSFLSVLFNVAVNCSDCMVSATKGMNEYGALVE